LQLLTTVADKRLLKVIIAHFKNNQSSSVHSAVGQGKVNAKAIMCLSHIYWNTSQFWNMA